MTHEKIERKVIEDLREDIRDIKPMFVVKGGSADCSCYTTIMGKPHGKCRHYQPIATGSSQYQCSIGGGTMAGRTCVPYYRYLHAVRKIDEHLRKLEHEFWESPEWDGCKLAQPRPMCDCCGKHPVAEYTKPGSSKEIGRCSRCYDKYMSWNV